MPFDITEQALFDLGFRLGGTSETYRLDGLSSTDYMYLQVTPVGEGVVKCWTYAESPPFKGDWLCLDSKIFRRKQALVEFLSQVFDQVFNPNESRVRPVMPLGFFESRGLTNG